MEDIGKIVKVSGPLVVAEGLKKSKMYEIVKVGEEKLLGEIIEIRGTKNSIQVYEETEGIGPGGPVIGLGMPLSVELGPGLMSSIFDGVQRPLNVLREEYGDFVIRGAEKPAIDRKKKWLFTPTCKKGDVVTGGDILGNVQETIVVIHKILVPPDIEGEIIEIKEGEFTVEEPIAKIKTKEKIVELPMLQKWPVRRGRPFLQKLAPKNPLTTGQRVIDMFFPITKGGTACVPGPFGSGKTIVQHQLSKWADAEIIVFIGCGERGNEMTDVLLEFPKLKDPRTGEALMNRTILVANTSNMPVAAREASIFTGITIAEYYRDMGYSVALMADSSSRWAEAMREICGRLEEMPGEEGYPAYLGSRLASFYERAGDVVCLGKDKRRGALSVIGAVSPPGGDLSEPVTQATLRVVKVFWGLDDRLASQRHFPAINWLNSYSLYNDEFDHACMQQIDKDWKKMRIEAMKLLQREAELEEIVRLVGIDTLSPKDRITLESAKSIREDFLHQNAYHEIDTYTSLTKQIKLLKLIYAYYTESLKALEEQVKLEAIIDLPVRTEIARAKYIPENELSKFDEIEEKLKEQFAQLKVKQ